MKHFNINPSASSPLHILLADDDQDDRFFFNRALQALPYHLNFTTIEDGEKLMTYLNGSSVKLPDLLFLDHNMPRKNGSECLLEIKQNPKLKNLPVIIYSTYLHEDVATIFYENGAHYYIRKTDVPELKKIISHILTLIYTKKFIRPSRSNFILSPMEV